MICGVTMIPGTITGTFRSAWCTAVTTWVICAGRLTSAMHCTPALFIVAIAAVTSGALIGRYEVVTDFHGSDFETCVW